MLTLKPPIRKIAAALLQIVQGDLIAGEIISDPSDLIFYQGGLDPGTTYPARPRCNGAARVLLQVNANGVTPVGMRAGQTYDLKMIVTFTVQLLAGQREAPESDVIAACETLVGSFTKRWDPPALMAVPGVTGFAAKQGGVAGMDEIVINYLSALSHPFKVNELKIFPGQVKLRFSLRIEAYEDSP